MKNRRIVVALLVIAILCVGVGYAALSDTINFTGNITYSPSIQIVWGNATYETGLLTDVAGMNTENFTVTMDTTEWDVGVTKTFTVEVKNNTTINATSLTVTQPTDAPANYTVVTEISADKLDAGDTAIVTVKVTMNSYPTTEVNAAFTFKVTGETA